MEEGGWKEGGWKGGEEEGRGDQEVEGGDEGEGALGCRERQLHPERARSSSRFSTGERMLAFRRRRSRLCDLGHGAMSQGFGQRHAGIRVSPKSWDDWKALIPGAERELRRKTRRLTSSHTQLRHAVPSKVAVQAGDRAGAYQGVMMMRRLLITPRVPPCFWTAFCNTRPARAPQARPCAASEAAAANTQHRASSSAGPSTTSRQPAALQLHASTAGWTASDGARRAAAPSLGCQTRRWPFRARWAAGP